MGLGGGATTSRVLRIKMGDGRLPTRSGDSASRATARRCPLPPPPHSRPPALRPPSRLFARKLRARPSPELPRKPRFSESLLCAEAGRRQQPGGCTGSAGTQRLRQPQRHSVGRPGRGRSAPAPIAGPSGTDPSRGLRRPPHGGHQRIRPGASPAQGADLAAPHSMRQRERTRAGNGRTEHTV